MNKNNVGNFKDYTGKIFNNFTVISYKGNSYWKVQCICGNIKQIRASKLNTQISCGCLKDSPKGNLIHGKYTSSEYSSWLCMKSRCLNTNDTNYSNYGGRGITICNEWINSFEQFYKDLGKKPNNKYTLERIDTNGNYVKNNCKWSTRQNQSNNRRNTKFITYKNKTKPLTIWCAELNIKPSTIRGRLRKGLSIEDAFETPIKS